VYSLDERQSMMSQLVRQKYVPRTDSAWTRPENRAELVENLRTMKEPSTISVTKNEFIGRLEKLEGLDEGYLSKSKTTDDVNKHKTDIKENDYMDRLPARLAEEPELTEEKLQTEGGNSEGDGKKEEKSKSATAPAEKTNSVDEKVKTKGGAEKSTDNSLVKETTPASVGQGEGEKGSSKVVSEENRTVKDAVSTPETKPATTGQAEKGSSKDDSEEKKSVENVASTQETRPATTGAAVKEKIVQSPSLAPLSETPIKKKEETGVKDKKLESDGVQKELPDSRPNRADEPKELVSVKTKVEEKKESLSFTNSPEKQTETKNPQNEKEQTTKSTITPEETKKQEIVSKVDEEKDTFTKDVTGLQSTQEAEKPKILLDAIRFEIKTIVDVKRGPNGGILSRMIKIIVKLRDRLPDNTHIVKLNVIPYQMKHACYSAMVSAAKIEEDNKLTVFGDLEYRITLEPLDVSGNQLAKPSGIYLEAGSTVGDEKFDHTLVFRTVNLHGLDRTWLNKTFSVLGKIEPKKLKLRIWPEAGGFETELTVRGSRSSMNLEKIRSSLGDHSDVRSKLLIDQPDWEVFLDYLREASDVSVFMKRESPDAPVVQEDTISETPQHKWGLIIFLLCLCCVTIRTIKKHFNIMTPSDILTLAESAARGRYESLSREDLDDNVEGDSSNDVGEFLAAVLNDLKVPQFEHKKYFNALNEVHLRSVSQLQSMDAHDWLKIDIPSTVKDEMRIRLLQIKEEFSKKTSKKKTKKLLSLKDPTKRTDRGIQIVDDSSDDNWK